MSLKNLNAKTLIIDYRNINLFFVFTQQSVLYLYDRLSDTATEIACLPFIDCNYQVNLASGDNSHRPSSGKIEMHFLYPYISIVEKHGLSALVYNLETKETIEFSRGNYYAAISSYGTSFLKESGRVLFIHQTDWNRLDITDLETKTLLTDRNNKSPSSDQDIPEENSIDYFHSELHFAPNYQHFLVNGWIWHPVDQIICFRTATFMEHFEVRHTIGPQGLDRNWDRPCCFINNQDFVIAMDNYSSSSEDEPYQQLWFYKCNDIDTTDQLELIPYKKLDIKLFEPEDEFKGVHGSLFYSAASNSLIAASYDGLRILKIDTEELSIIKTGPMHDLQFSGELQLMYRYLIDKREIEILYFSPDNHTI